jgi:hypothetical protein
MYLALPGDLLTGGWELFCYGFTVLAAVLSWLISGR